MVFLSVRSSVNSELGRGVECRSHHWLVEARMIIIRQCGEKRTIIGEVRVILVHQLGMAVNDT